MKNFGEYLMSYDSFSETFRMKLEHGQAALPSIMGTIFSFISFMLIIGYTAQKFDILISRKDVDIVLSVRENFFGDDETITGRQGLNIAVAFTGFDTIEENVLLPQFASIVFEYAAWEILDNGEIIDAVTTV